MKNELIQAAETARGQAYAPYSKYNVGAAIADEHGHIHLGCNVENVSFPVGMCAERVAIGAMVASGGREIREIVVRTRDGGTPCGMCLQAIAEFSPDPARTVVTVVGDSQVLQEFTLAELLPNGFRTQL